MKQLLMSIMLVLMLVSCGIGSNEMTTDRAYKSLLGFTQTDGDFLEYDKGRSMGEVIGVVKTGESKVEIMFTVLNEQCDYTCDPLSNGKATAFVTTDGKWILDCIEYEDEYGNIFTGRQECNVNRDMDEMAKGAISSTGNEAVVDANAGNDELAPQGEVDANAGNDELAPQGEVDAKNINESAANPIPESTVYNNYNPDGNHLKPESLVAMQKYTTEIEQPHNVQVLKGWNTKQISNYMITQVAGGLKVDCSYCHNINNFADESNPNKGNARAMMLMSGDLNRSFVSKLPVSVGGYNITCATCHNGKPKFETYPTEIQNTLPNDYRLPLEREYPGGLVITGVDTKSLDEVALNQNTMYHMNLSLGQGCTFCHNVSNFPATGVKDGGRDQKQYAIWMLQMAKHIKDKYSPIMANQTPSCWMCHQGNTVPPGAAKAGQVPDVLSTTSSAP